MSKIPAFTLLPVLVLGLSTDAHAQATPEPAPAPVTAAWQALIGTWVADNSRFKSATDDIDAYGIEWSWGLNKKSLIGRLYGIKNGQPAGSFWEFREFWHPSERTLITMQFGSDGSYGVGPHTLNSGGASEMLQTFFDPDQKTIFKVGHRSTLEGDVHTTTSYTVDDKGTWTERRTYVWRRQHR